MLFTCRDGRTSRSLEDVFVRKILKWPQCSQDAVRNGFVILHLSFRMSCSGEFSRKF